MKLSLWEYINVYYLYNTNKINSITIIVFIIIAFTYELLMNC